MKKLNLAVIGVGAVGLEILKILRERNFPFSNLRVFARSARTIELEGISYEVEAIEGADFKGIDIALFAGTEGEKGASKQYAHKFIKEGAVVIDNGADFRMEREVPLIVPEVNYEKIFQHKGLIANPNCTTIQAVVSLAGIEKKFGLEGFILVSFQSVSGAGSQAEKALWQQMRQLGEINKQRNYPHLIKKVPSQEIDVFPKQIAFNLIPQIGGFDEAGYTSEEQKVVNESRKIFDNYSLKITSTCVRVPVFRAHSEAIYFTVKKDATPADIEEVLKESPGVKYFPSDIALPLEAEGKNEVFVSRLRQCSFNKNSFWIWTVADNLRKGAALNAVQIAEVLLKQS